MCGQAWLSFQKSPLSSGRRLRRVMASSDRANSLDEDLGTTETDDGSLDTILRQLEQEKRLLPSGRSQSTGASTVPVDFVLHKIQSVPLAEPEDFPEDNGNMTEDDMPNLPTPDDDVFLDDEQGGEGQAPQDKGGGDSEEEEEEEDDDVEEIGAANGPLNHHMIDVNGNGTTKNSRWLDTRPPEFRILDPAPVSTPDQVDDEPIRDFDMQEFAKKYFNVHFNNSGYSGAISKTVNIVRGRSQSEVIPIRDMLCYTKSSNIPSSHLQLHNPDNTAMACTIFKDLGKYMKGEMKEDVGHVILRGVVGLGMQRIELRDEIYCQLYRQTNGNPHKEYLLRLWLLWSLCAVCISPSRTLNKYILTFLRKVCDEERDEKISHYANFCLRHLRQPRGSTRRLPPSMAEIEAIRSQKPLLCRVYFLDGKTKAVGVDINVSAHEALDKIKEKICLKNLYGWALYESTPDHDRYIKGEEYLADIFSEWEDKQEDRRWRYPALTKLISRKQRAQAQVGSPKKGVPKVPLVDYGKIIFCKRLYIPLAEMQPDPVEYHLLFAQVLHHNVQVDEYMLPKEAAVQLAGFHAQVLHRDYDEAKHYRYTNVEDYLCQRILQSETLDWPSEIAMAHKKIGSGLAEMDAKIRYITLISQFPLYGCVKFFAHYKGLWRFGVEFVLAVSHTDVKFISIEEKTIAYEYRYTDIELVQIDFEQELVTIMLLNQEPNKQKCYLFECLDIEDFATLLEVYASHLVTWTDHDKARTKMWVQVLEADWIKLSDEVVRHRHRLVQSGLMNGPQNGGFKLLKYTLKRISGRGCGNPGSSLEDHIDLRGAYWSYSKMPFKHALIAFESHELDDVAVRMFNSTLVYTGLESVALLEDMDLITVVQTLIIKCMESEDLCNEFYLQLIKQTTDTPPEPSNTAALRYWHLMTMATCCLIPTNNLILSYLKVHLRRYALEEHTEEGKYALFCYKSLYRTCEGKGRKYPPSYQEVACVIKRQQMDLLMNLPNGQQLMVEFDSATPASQVMEQVKSKIGMRLDSKGFGVFESLDGSPEQFLALEDKLADSLYKWEKWAQSNNTTTKDLRFSFKKRIFVDPYVNECDPIEVDMLYHQSVTDVFECKIPLTKEDAIRLCALRAQTEFSDHGQASNFDYVSVMRILPRHLRDLINIADIAAIHASLAGTSPMSANVAFLDILHLWPLYGATFYKVTTYSDSVPKWVWLAVSSIGVHIMERWGQVVYHTYTHEELVHCSPTFKTIIIVVQTSSKQNKLVFNTSEASQIVQLINDYRDVILGSIVTSFCSTPRKDERTRGKKKQTKPVVATEEETQL